MERKSGLHLILLLLAVTLPLGVGSPFVVEAGTKILRLGDTGTETGP